MGELTSEGEAIMIGDEFDDMSDGDSRESDEVEFGNQLAELGVVTEETDAGTGEHSEAGAVSLGAGSAEEYSEHWFVQAVDGTCVPASVAQIVSEYTGTLFPDESVFTQYAIEAGLMPDGISGGMTAEAGAQILQAAGIPANVYSGDFETLDSLLESGHGVMVAVDSGYWDPGQEVIDQLSGVDEGADHCVVISEIDYESGVVYLSDTGTEGGDMLEVPIYQFAESWAESGNQMVVCEVPSPNYEGEETLQPVTPADDSGYDISAVVSGITDGPWVLLPVRLAAAIR